MDVYALVTSKTFLAYLPAAISLVAAFIAVGGTLTCAIFTYRLNSKRAELDFRRKKLEELWDIVDTTNDGITNFYQKLQSLMDCQHLPLSGKDIAELKELRNQNHHDTVVKLLAIYFPAIEDTRSAYSECLGKLSGIGTACMEEFNNDPNSSGYKELRSHLHELIDIASGEYNLFRLILRGVARKLERGNLNQ